MASFHSDLSLTLRSRKRSQSTHSSYMAALADSRQTFSQSTNAPLPTPRRPKLTEVSELLAIAIRRPVEASLAPHSTLRLRTCGEQGATVPCSANPAIPQRAQRGGTKASQSTETGGKERGNTLQPSDWETPHSWKPRPHLLLSLSRGQRNLVNEQQRHRHGRRDEPKPPPRCHVRCCPFCQRKLSSGWI